MVYEAFLTALTDRLRLELGANYQIQIRKIPKNNGVILDGLCIQAPGFPMSPTIYLNSYFEQYETGMSVESIIQDILGLYRSTTIPASLAGTNLSNLDLYRSKIMFKLIHAESNAALLEDVPHIPYLDLAIVFYLYLDRSESGQMTALIHTDHMNRWNLKVGQLWKLALANTPLYFPASIQNMKDMLKEIARKSWGDQYPEAQIESLLEEEAPEAPLYVLSNQHGLNGACCMLYQNILKDFADSIGMDLIILPSSIHEVLITPNLPGTSYEDLSELVTVINQREVSLEDQLSNQVYLYTRADDRIRIVSHAPSKVGAAAAH